MDRAEPNPGHTALARLQKLVPRLTLITQNVDGLHQRAGNEDVIEFHGNLMHDRCTSGHPVIRRAARLEQCERCGAPMRPAVVWFGEPIPTAALERSMSAAADCDVFFTIGTSSQVQPAASLATLASDRGAVLVEINPQPTPLTTLCDHAFTQTSGRLLPEIVAALEAKSGHA